MEGNVVVEYDVISQMIQSVVDTQEAQQRDRAAKLSEYQKAMEEALHEALGEELWTRLFPYMQADLHNEGRDSFALYVHVTEAIPLQLAPFVFSVKNSNGYARMDYAVMVSPASSIKYYPITQLGEVLAECRKRFPQYNRDRLEKLTNPIASRLQNCIYDHQAKSPEQADAYYDQLMRIDPENAEQWQQLRTAWTIIYENYQKQKEEGERRRAWKEQELDRYETALEGYCRDYLETIKANREKCQALQHRLTGTVQYWKLTYALLGEDDGDRMVETNYAYVAAPNPDEHGYWSVYDRGAILTVRYMNPVSVEGPMELSITDGTAGITRSWYVPEAGGYAIYYRPGLNIASMIDALGLQTLPDVPTTPDVSYHWECERMEAIRKGVREKLEAEGYDSDDLHQISRRVNHN